MTVTNAVETTMIWGTVSGASMVGMVISLLLSVGLPIFLCIFIYKKTKAWVPAFFIGCGIFVGFAMILEQICHAIVLTVTGSVIRDNLWLYAIYGGLAAALFEECGRWIAMKFCLKKHLTRENALMYGAVQRAPHQSSATLPASLPPDIIPWCPHCRSLPTGIPH